MTGQENKRLVCAATLQELRTYWRDGEDWELSSSDPFINNGETAYLLTGVGIPCTLARLLPVVSRLRPAMILNIGIAGAYPGRNLGIGDIVMGSEEVYGDIGFELPEEPGFRPLSEAPFGTEIYRTPFPLSLDPIFRFQSASYGVHVERGCTVNNCTGTEWTGRMRECLFSAGFETMEGAAVAQVGLQEGIPVCEVRAISNKASHRDMRPENIALALTHLAHYLQSCRQEEGC